MWSPYNTILFLICASSIYLGWVEPEGTGKGYWYGAIALIAFLCLETKEKDKK